VHLRAVGVVALLHRVVTLRAVAGADAGHAFAPDGFIELSGAEAQKAHEYPVRRIGQLALEFDVCRERFEAPRLFVKAVASDTSHREP
jgi:hypothetical protein